MEEKIVIYGEERAKKQRTPRDKMKKFKEFFGYDGKINCRNIFCGYQFMDENGEGKCVLGEIEIDESGKCDGFIIPHGTRANEKRKLEFLERDVADCMGEEIDH